LADLQVLGMVGCGKTGRFELMRVVIETTVLQINPDASVYTQNRSNPFVQKYFFPVRKIFAFFSCMQEFYKVQF
jgi:hypothetical protein